MMFPFALERFVQLSIPYGRLAQLSHNLATCLAAGIPLPQALRTTTRSLAASGAGPWARVAERLEGGEPLADALQSADAWLPTFYRPVVAAGEYAGRLDEVLRVLAEQCRLLDGPTRAVRNAWLGPLIIYLAATPLHLLMVVFLGSWSQVPALMLDLVAQVGSLATLGVLILAPPFKPAWDRLRLWVPVWGGAERALGIARFLRVFAMLYAAGGTRVEHMLRFAARSVANEHLRHDLLRAAKQVERGHDLHDAFSSCTCLNAAERDTLSAGELAGTLEQSCTRLAKGLDDDVAARMRVVTFVATRVMLGLVALSLVSALAGLLPLILLHTFS